MNPLQPVANFIFSTIKKIAKQRSSKLFIVFERSFRHYNGLFIHNKSAKYAPANLSVWHKRECHEMSTGSRLPHYNGSISDDKTEIPTQSNRSCHTLYCGVWINWLYAYQGSARSFFRYENLISTKFLGLKLHFLTQPNYRKILM